MGVRRERAWATLKKAIARPDRAAIKLGRMAFGTAPSAPPTPPVPPPSILPNHALAARLTPRERFALVPEHFANKVHGQKEADTFENVGRLSVESIAEQAGPLSGPADVLDFGCGFGRTLLPLRAAWPKARLTGFDIDPLMLEWGRFMLHGQSVAFHASTMGMADRSFDLIYAISVFTHLDETAEFWLAEIRRLLKPNGRAYLTYLDETLYAERTGTPKLRDTVTGERLADRAIVGRGTAEGGIRMGAYYTTSVWTGLLSRFFQVVRVVPRGLFGLQSLAVVSPLADPPAHWADLQRQYIQALERELADARLKLRLTY